jgi:hypothetical protein
MPRESDFMPKPELAKIMTFALPFLAALKSLPDAKRFFETLNKSNQYAISN